MNYEKLLKTIIEIVKNPDIEKTGLTLVYQLPEKLHRKFEEDLYYRFIKNGPEPTSNEEYELEIGGIVVKFVRKPETIEITEN